MQIVTNFSLLEKNLLEICESERSGDSLIVFPGDSVLCKESTFTGSVCCHLYAVIDGLTNFWCTSSVQPREEESEDISYRGYQVMQVVKKTAFLWQEACLDLHHLGKEYLTCIVKANNSSTSIRQLRSQILSITSSLTFLDFETADWSVAQKATILHQFFMRQIQKSFADGEAQTHLIPFFESYWMVCVKGILQKSWPLESLKLLLNGEEDIPEEPLKEWLLSVEAHKSSLVVGKLHKAICGAVHALLPELDLKSEKFSSSVYQLEWELYKRGLHMLQDSDEEQLKWIESLSSEAPPSLRDISQKEIRLGARIVFPSSKDFDVVFFEIEGDETKLVLCGNSVVQVGLWKAACEKLAFGVQPLECSFADPLGRFWITEKVDVFLQDIKFNSMLPAPESSMWNYLRELVQVIKGFLNSQEGIPEFTSESSQKQVQFCFVRGYKLRVFPMLQQKRSCELSPEGILFHEIEAFCERISQGNPYVLNHLMRATGLVKHRYAVLYADIVQKQLLPSWFEAVFGSPKMTVAEEIALENIVDEELLTRATALVGFFDEAAKSLLNELRPHLRDKEETAVRRYIIEHLLQFQQERGYYSRAHPNLLKKDTLALLGQDVIKRHRELFEESAYKEMDSIFTRFLS